ncbi:MAG TPA: phenylalanine--tRNA ligase subunit alpha, partial [Actinomycetota bacterium]|nr:phenylalanine--tRNA ligase subunit alpha [Actinomycetota bacterium]
MASDLEPAHAISILDAELERGQQLAAAASTVEELERSEPVVLGRKAPLASVQRELGRLSDEDRRTVGQRTNEVRDELRRIFSERRGELEAEREAAILAADRIDVTLPGRQLRPGSFHPLTLIEYRIVDIFTRLGYRVVEGPEVENDWYNFEALNIPPDHPARTEKDTVYLDVPGGLLLRTETSAVQIRTMENQPPPVYVISPGRVYRQDTPDATHSPVFHQVEGLAVDEGISMADLRGTLETFAKAMFGEETRVRFTPDYFPFVEPGAEMAISCFV